MQGGNAPRVGSTIRTLTELAVRVKRKVPQAVDLTPAGFWCHDAAMLTRRLFLVLVLLVGFQVRSAHAQGSGGVTTPAATKAPPKVAPHAPVAPVSHAAPAAAPVIAHDDGSGSGASAPAPVATPTPAPSDGSGSAVPAAGSGSGSGSTTLTTTTTASPSGATTTTVVTMPDPTKDPLGFIAAVKAMWTTSWGVALALAVVGLLELLAWVGAKSGISALAWLGTGRVSVIIGAATGVLTTAIAAFATGGWTAFLTAVGGGVLAYWHQGGVDPAKAINPVPAVKVAGK